MSYRSDDGLGTSDAFRFRTTTDIAVDLRTGATVHVDLVSFDADGFTLNFSGADTVTYGYLAFPPGISAKLGSFNFATAGATQAITGVGFQPSLAIFLWAHKGADGLQTTFAAQGIGFASSPSAEACAQHFSNDLQASAQDKHQWFENRSIAFGSNGSAGDRAYADLASFDADGFTLNLTKLPADATDQVGYLALAGFPATVLPGLTAPTSVGSKSYTGAGFEPNTVLLIAQKDTANSPDATAANALLSVGASDGATHGLAWAGGVDGAPTMIEKNRFYNDKCVAMITPGNPPTVAALGALTSFDADGFTLDWSTVDATAWHFSALCMQLPPVIPRLRGGNRWWWWRGY